VGKFLDRRKAGRGPAAASDSSSSSGGLRLPPGFHSDRATNISLTDVLRALGLEHATYILDAASRQMITRNDSPTSSLDRLMCDVLRVQTEKRAQQVVKRLATTLDTYDFDYSSPSTAKPSLAFIKGRTNVALNGRSGVGRTHLANGTPSIAVSAPMGSLRAAHRQ
jgi:hypothetical protein